MNINKRFLASLTIAFLGEIAYVNQALAQQPLLHDAGTVGTTQAIVSPPSNSTAFTPAISATVNVSNGTITIILQTGTTTIPVSPGLLNQIIIKRTTSSKNNSVIPNSIPIPPLSAEPRFLVESDLIDSDKGVLVSGFGILPEGNAISGETSTNASDDNNSLKMTVCFREPCLPKTEGDIAITFNELANELVELIEADLNQSLADLALAEASEPRTITRRRTISKLRSSVATKLEQAQNFIEQIEKLNPENSAW